MGELRGVEGGEMRSVRIVWEKNLFSIQRETTRKGDISELGKNLGQVTYLQGRPQLRLSSIRVNYSESNYTWEKSLCFLPYNLKTFLVWIALQNMFVPREELISLESAKRPGSSQTLKSFFSTHWLYSLHCQSSLTECFQRTVNCISVLDTMLSPLPSSVCSWPYLHSVHWTIFIVFLCTWQVGLMTFS